MGKKTTHTQTQPFLLSSTKLKLLLHIGRMILSSLSALVSHTEFLSHLVQVWLQKSQDGAGPIK